MTRRRWIVVALVILLAVAGLVAYLIFGRGTSSTTPGETPGATTPVLTPSVTGSSGPTQSTLTSSTPTPTSATATVTTTTSTTTQARATTTTTTQTTTTSTSTTTTTQPPTSTTTTTTEPPTTTTSTTRWRAPYFENVQCTGGAPGVADIEWTAKVYGMVPSRVEWDVTINYRDPWSFGDNEVHAKTTHLGTSFVVIEGDSREFYGLTSYHPPLVKWHEGLELVSCSWTDPEYV
jgi:hypothetical protein